MQVPEPKAGRLDFRDYRFQIQLYDQHGAYDPEMIIKKATQVGVSTYLLRWVMFHADKGGLTALYVFPKRKQLYDFSDARVKPAIQGSQYLLGRIPRGSIDNKGLKQIGLGWLYARGSESKADLDSVDADALALDEYDTLRQENIPDAERRISGSRDGLLRRVGVPSIPGFGIDRAYGKTDQRRWFVRCECGHRQPLSYEDNVEEGEEAEEGGMWPTARLVCAKDGCRKPLDVREGEWVAAYPERSTRGYHMPRLIVPHANIPEIVKAHHSTNPYERKTHFNKDLAEAWAPAEGRLTLDAIEAATREELPAIGAPPSEGALVTGGLDVATSRNLNLRISLHHIARKPGERDYCTPLYVGEIEGFGDAEKLMQRYGVTLLTVDHLPEGRLARKLADRFPGRVWLVHFATMKSEVIRPDPEMREVAVRRTEAIDATFEQVRQQRRLLPGDPPPDYVEHLQALTRVQEEDEHGRMKVEYVHGGQPFDYAMAEVYDLVAKEVYLWRQGAEAAIEGTTHRFDELYDFEAEDLDAGTQDTSVRLDEYDPGFGG
jgi:hypothetical protein